AHRRHLPRLRQRPVHRATERRHRGRLRGRERLAAGWASGGDLSAPPFCAIDFGTSNSAIALPMQGRVELIEVEPGRRTMPTAVFYRVEGLAAHEEPQRAYGRDALAAYMEG